MGEIAKLKQVKKYPPVWWQKNLSLNPNTRLRNQKEHKLQSLLIRRKDMGGNNFNQLQVERHYTNSTNSKPMRHLADPEARKKWPMENTNLKILKN